MNSVNVLESVLYLLLDSSGKGEGKKKRLIRHMQLSFSLGEYKNESMTVSGSHKTAFRGEGYQVQHLTDPLNQAENSTSLGEEHHRRFQSAPSVLPPDRPHSPGVFYISYQSISRWDCMGCSYQVFPSAGKLVQEPIM